MLFPVGRVTYISYSIGWEVSLVGRNTITHGGNVGPVATEDDERLIECTGSSNYSIVRCSVFDPEPELGCRPPIRQSDELWVLLVFDPVRSLFDVGPEVDIQMCCRPVVVVQTRCRCSGALSLFVVVVLLFGVLLFSCSVFLSCLITQNFQDLVLYDVHSLRTAVATEGLSSIYTISDERGLGLQCRRQCRKGRSLPVRGTLGNWIQPVFLAYVGGAR